MMISADSVFLDSPLTPTGIRQGQVLYNELERTPVTDSAEDEYKRVLRGERGTSVIVASNLRRAMSTAAIALQGRMKRTGERIKILTCLQEVSRNVDTLALAKAYDPPEILSAI